MLTEAAAHFVKDKSAQEIAGAMMRGADAPDVVASLTLVIEAYGESRVKAERQRWAVVARPFVQLWEDGTVIGSAELRRFVRQLRGLLA